MNKVFLYFAIFAIAFGGVISLTPENFDSSLSEAKSGAFIKFFAPWCGHCKRLAPDWEALAEGYKSKNVLIGEVDCDQYKELCSRFGVKGYPTIKFFPNGDAEKVEDYKEGRSLDDLSNFVQKRTGFRMAKPQSNVVDVTNSNFNEIVMDPKKAVIVAFTAPWCGHCQALKPNFKQAADSFKPHDNVVFANINADDETELRDKFGVTGFPTIKYFPRGEDKQGQDWSSGRDAQAFIDFLNINANTERKLGGDLTEGAGKIKALTKIAKNFISEKKEETIEEVKQLVSDMDGIMKSNGEYYIRVFTNFLKKGVEYPEKEITRLSKILSKSINDAKNDEFVRKINILGDFVVSEEKDEL